MLNIEKNKQINLLPYFVLLLLLFSFRVIAQLLQYFFNLSFLPPFESWDSNTLPYGILIIMQIIIVFSFSKIIYKIARKRIVPNLNTGYIFTIFGALYFIIMFFRLIAGLTIFDYVKWFAYPIPSFFHLVLDHFLHPLILNSSCLCEEQKTQDHT